MALAYDMTNQSQNTGYPGAPFRASWREGYETTSDQVAEALLDAYVPGAPDGITIWQGDVWFDPGRDDIWTWEYFRALVDDLNAP